LDANAWLESSENKQGVHTPCLMRVPPPPPRAALSAVPVDVLNHTLPLHKSL
jgi:hypothetical protein